MTLATTDHFHSDRVEQAAAWLAEQNQAPRPAVPALKQRFGLSPVEACEAIAMARKFPIVRRAFG